jgi:hypothetical protein
VKPITTYGPDGQVNGRCQVCAGCGELKRVGDFLIGWPANPKIGKECKKCLSKKKRNEYARAFRYKSTYGISVHDVDHLIRLQNGKCACCGAGFTSIGKLGKRMPVVDHCHGNGGHVRGVICNACNIAEGMIGTAINASRLLAYTQKNELFEKQEPLTA